jgi:hypothetical protein
MPRSICDFCSSPNVTCVYPARTFAAYVFEGIVGESVGDWAACPICRGLIESGRHTELTERALITLLERQPEMKSAEQELRTHIRSFHRMFFRSRVGAAMTIT